MEHIIHQIVTSFTTQAVNSILEHGLCDIGKLAKQLNNLIKSVTLSILNECIQQMDSALVAASKERKADGVRIKERNVPRCLTTELGDLRYTRTYFEGKGGDRFYLIDHLIGVAPYERLSDDLCAALVQASADTSMGNAAKMVGVSVSRQTVNNKVFALQEVAIDAVPASETPQDLHLFADEDHVHLKNGRTGVVPLVTVTEGIDTSKKRHETISPIHFEGYAMDNQKFFEGISSFLYKRYDMDVVENVYIHSDAGKWIEAAQEWLPNVRFVMDGFHLEKRFRQLSKIPGAAARMGVIRKAIRNDRKKDFIAQCTEIDKNLCSLDHDKLIEQRNFIQSHWDSIVLRLQKTVCGSCTEPLVSHILSSRLSRNPLAWSKRGLSQMAMLRVYVKNGGVVSANDICTSAKRSTKLANMKSLGSGYAKYRKLADNQINDFLCTKLDWSVFAPPSQCRGKLDAVGILRKAYSASRNYLASA